MGILLGRWDCQYCSQKGIPADVRHCPNCGNPVGENVKYYLPTGSKDYVDPNVVPKGPDWQCAYCSSYNRYDAVICSNCGASRNEGTNYFEATSGNSGSMSPPDTDTGRENSVPTYQPDTNTYGSGNIPRTSSYQVSRRKQWFILFLTGLAIAAIIGIISFIAAPKEKTLTVDGFSWERTIYIDEYKTVKESDWHMPPGARYRYTREEIRSYDHQFAGYKTETYTEQEIDHYEDYVSGYRDLGNGYFEEIYSSRPVYKTVTKTREVPYYIDIPIYDTKYYYDIDKWVAGRKVETKGTDQNPYWGPEPPTVSGKPKIGDEKVSRRSEDYYIVGTIEGKKKSRSYAISYNDWEKLQQGDKIRCMVSIDGDVELLDVIYEEVQ